MNKFIALYTIISISVISLLSLKANDTVQKCVQIKCGKKGSYEFFTGTSEADIAAQIKQKYNTCTFKYVDKSKCKNQ
jgi:hypothetical protein